jgi:hypothetical protein
MMRDALPILITLGLSLFILRTQLLRVAIREGGMDNLHASAALGAASGWASLFGAAALIAASFISLGLLWGAGLIALSIMLGIISAAFTLPTIGSTSALGHLSGKGNASIAAFNRAYGHWIGFSVGALALVCLSTIFTFRV